MEWNSFKSAGQAIEKHPYAWVHFTDVPKLGINPQKTHRDPPGVYFYPTKFLIQRNQAGFQYGLTMKYYYICNVDLRSGKGINLSNVRWDTVKSIAGRNGWIDWLMKGAALVEANFKLRRKDQRNWDFLAKSSMANSPQGYALFKKPGGLFYAVADYLASTGVSWVKLLRGVDYLFDPSYGIISPNEISQLCVMNTRLISILEFGENRDTYSQGYAQIVGAAAKEFGGTWRFRNKLPEIILSGDKPMRIVYDHEGRLGTPRIYFYYYKNGISVSDSEKIEGTFSEQAIESYVRSLVYYIGAHLKLAEPKGVDLEWTEAKVRQFFAMLYANGQYATFRGYVEKDRAGMTYQANAPRGDWYRGSSVWLRTDATGVAQVTLGGGMSGWSSDDPRLFDFRVDREFPRGTPMETMAKEILDAAARGILDSIEAGSTVDPYGAVIITGLNFGDRFGTAQEHAARVLARKVKQARSPQNESFSFKNCLVQSGYYT